MAPSTHRQVACCPLAAVVILGWCATTWAVEFAGGTGEPNDPYQIATAEQLTSIGSDPNLLDKHYVLIADIDLDPNLPGGHIFDSALIARARIVAAHVVYVDCDPFTGSFDGNGWTIRNLTVHAKEEVDAYVGLFGRVEGRVQNVRLEDVNMSGGSRVGGLAGFNQGTIVGCCVSGVVSGERMVGAVVGWNEGVVSCCYAVGQVRGDTTVGGLIGSNTGEVDLSYAVSSAPDPNDQIGGLLGSNGGTVYLSYWDIQASGVATSDGGRPKTTEQMMDRRTFLGWGHEGQWILDDGRDYPRLLWEGTPGTLIVDPPNRYGGGTGEPNTPFEIWSAQQLLSLGYCPGDFNDCFVLMADIDMSETDPNLLVPIGTARWPFAGQFDGNGYAISNLVCWLEGLNYVGLFGCVEHRFTWPDDPAHQHYRPGAVKNVHLADVVIQGRGCTGALMGLNKGIVRGCIATGVVTGLSHTGGLIGANEGEVRDCHYLGDVDGGYCTGGLCGGNGAGGAGMTSCSATGTVRGTNHVGGLVGSHSGRWNELTSCSAQSQVTGVDAVGGLVGYHGGRLHNSYSISTVTGQTRVGGLIGHNGSGDVVRCTCSGQVLGDSEVGGLAGDNYDATITSCYATASVTGHNAVGGLVGHNYEGTVACSYAASVVVGDGNDVGGFVGRDQYTGSFLLCYWDTDVSGLTSSQGGFGRPTRLMQQARTFRGWYADNWTIREGMDYPRLAWEEKGGAPILTDVMTYGGGTGEPNDPYQIWTPEQFLEVAYQPAHFSKRFILMADIDMAQVDPVEVIPIGSGARSFTGRFNGNGHTIFNFRCIHPGSPYVGVFGVLGWTGEPYQKPENLPEVLTRLHMVDAHVSGGSYTGGLAGIAGGHIVDSSVTGRIDGANYAGGLVGSISGDTRGASCDVVVRGEKYVGGLAGCSNGSIEDSWANGATTGADWVGGLVGGGHGGSLASCVCACKVDASGQCAGGMAGTWNGPIMDCSATGDVSGSRYVGGLVGLGYDLRGCYATGQVAAAGDYVGGLAGMSGPNATEITACWATGAVRGRDYVGGLVGYGWVATVSQCFSRSDVVGRTGVGGLVGWMLGPVDSGYARGDVTGHRSIGGLIGFTAETISRCYSTGRVVGDIQAHGLLGESPSTGIESCFWDVETSGVARDARWDQSGVTGKTTAEMQTATTFIDAGWDFANIWMICEGQDYPRLQWEGVECR